MTENTDINANFFSIFWWMNATVENVKAEIAKGADVNAKNEYGWTPFMYAAEYSENPEIVRLMVEKGADIEARDMQDISQADYEIADIVIKLEALNGYKEPVDLIVERTMHGKTQTIRANENSLKYAEALKNCEHLWFYES